MAEAPRPDADALDFAPELLAIQERPPQRMPRAIALTLVALVGLLLAWAAFFELDIIATAEIQQGRRSVLEYLLSPVRKVAQEAARER